MTPPNAHASSANGHTPPPCRTPPLRGSTECSTSPHALGKAASGSQTTCLHRSKDEIWILAGLSAEVWAETRGEEGVEKGMGMVESELGRIVVVPVDNTSPELQDEREPLLLLAVNGGAEADWKTMCAKRYRSVSAQSDVGYYEQEPDEEYDYVARGSFTVVTLKRTI
ncbi:hypothetical protein EV424DRAFT_1345944 [Suillus variegatus]|nr:hypothetical protein EV424DRAFT_1345944 [Suillus variegatus]